MDLDGQLAALQQEIETVLLGDCSDADRERLVPILNAMRASRTPEQLELTFRQPIEQGGKTYTSISCRGPTWGEMKGALKNGSIEASTWLANMLGGCPIPVLNKLDARDGAVIDRFFARFS